MIGTDPLHAAPILDLRIRKAVRRNGTALAVAGDRPTALDGGATGSCAATRPAARRRSSPSSTRRSPASAGDEPEATPASRRRSCAAPSGR